ncbi:epidermal growth factor receptor kinase substrate 8-like, partial [Teleopsis dalmanni]|uniref:epidermal growth factor receptor kinase substrate 8-like n=2 Tax=Teleopsis dalmanni TaxID=139649 RepID=UPI0018CDE4C2
SKNIIERFPATLIQEPTAFTSTDAMELYNNILVFIVSGGSGSRSEMHIFQSQSISAVHLVEDLQNLRNGQLIPQQRVTTNQSQQKQIDLFDMNKIISSSEQADSRDISHHSMSRHNEDHYENNIITEDVGIVASGDTDSDQGGFFNEENSSIASDKYERDVTVLNHCFDDIEKFIARLQHAAAASRELERRRRNRKTKKKDPGEGLLTLRTRPPHEKEFIDIFAKFKLSFNLLAKLKSHIHDPNAPELVHFLFTPLALIVEASSDTYDSQLAGRVINPLLTREAVNLLINCVTSKETELWRSLGDSWSIPRDQWKENISSYHPVFLDGWSPDYLVIDELEPGTAPSIIKHNINVPVIGADSMSSNGHSNNLVTGVTYDNRVGNNTNNFYNLFKVNKSDNVDHITTLGSLNYNTKNDSPADIVKRTENHGKISSVQTITGDLQNINVRDQKTKENNFNAGSSVIKGISKQNIISAHTEAANTNDVYDQQLGIWLEDLQLSRAKIVLVTYPRTANNDKELSVVRGEYLEILDDTRKWWKARNIHGQIAHVPHTIVTPYNYGEVEVGNQQIVTKSPFSDTLENESEDVSNNTSWNHNKHLGKKGEFRYF